jgi:DNA-binding IclR family transcriptional regulator
VAAGLEDQDLALLRALRARGETSLAELADSLGLPRSNFGRHLSQRLVAPVNRLIEAGFVKRDGARYRLSQRGRRLLAERALNGSL